MNLGTSILVGGLCSASLYVVCGLPHAMAAEAAPTAAAPAPEPDWLRGDVDTRFRLVAKHLRGFDMAMVEVGHRYVELYWAGRDRNWGYAEYQLGKIETAVANGVERRPKRAASAGMLDGPVAGMRTAIASEDSASFERAFTILTDTCNACHQAERVSFIHVRRPEARLSPVHGTAPAP